MNEYDQAIQMIKEKGIRPSFIRVRVLNRLISARVHPSVDDIYEALEVEIPTLSKTTVYNTLKLFTEKGLAQSLNIEGNELRYEAVRGFHGHFKCQECSRIFDLNIANIDFYDDMKDFVIKDEQVLVTGICPDCQMNSEI
ncbi:MAG: Fur family transcriptional regulator [Gudongella sp.]|jgi:Fe2+ or Zn2+ uptake regulation protein|nr:Fur family transcriptional regulator [Gudongella sp.]